MNPKVFIIFSTAILPLASAMASPTFCPQKSGYIDVGMTAEQVLNACGQPLAKERLNKPVTQKVPAQQLIYTSINTGAYYTGDTAAFYTQWSLPSGTSGVNITVQVINNKVSSVTMNGSSINSLSMCNGNGSGRGVNVGDDVSAVYTACGSPQMTNNTFIEQVVKTDKKPEVWIYKIDEFHDPMSLTFVNDKLQSID